MVFGQAQEVGSREAFLQATWNAPVPQDDDWAGRHRRPRLGTIAIGEGNGDEGPDGSGGEMASFDRAVCSCLAAGLERPRLAGYPARSRLRFAGLADAIASAAGDRSRNDDRTDQPIVAWSSYSPRRGNAAQRLPPIAFVASTGNESNDPRRRPALQMTFADRTHRESQALRLAMGVIAVDGAVDDRVGGV